jgi:hypothetical protein
MGLLPPRGWDPGKKIFISKIWPGAEAFLRAIWAFHRPPCNFPWGDRLRAVVGLLVALSAVDICFCDEALGHISGWPVLPAGQVVQKHLMPISSCLLPASPPPGPGPLVLGLCRMPDASGQRFPPSQCDLQSLMQGFRYANHMEKYAKGRIVASYVPLQPYRHLPFMPQGLKIDFPQNLCYHAS